MWAALDRNDFTGKVELAKAALGESFNAAAKTGGMWAALDRDDFTGTVELTKAALGESFNAAAKTDGMWAALDRNDFTGKVELAQAALGTSFNAAAKTNSMWARLMSPSCQKIELGGLDVGLCELGCPLRDWKTIKRIGQEARQVLILRSHTEL